MDIKEYMENYLNDLQVQADTLMISKEEAFVTDVVERLKESDICHLHTSDAADDGESVELGGRRTMETKRRRTGR
ncbi:hypothetical protein [Enterococcus cecorum]|uniref:hypothetical protein n=1 Tax=Enterococcus cecorum TaxID=44008 RepID=UPI001FADF1F7|nr:hypothetical protein [Enterococcus cecorum]MCJ0567999.1 hypothetical protein [Enterococcus cecorum]